jgi:hypothetical protein
LIFGERTHLACCRWQLANDFFLLGEEDFGEAPKSAREGACAPQKKRVIAHISFVMSSEVETSLDSVSLKNS